MYLLWYLFVQMFTWCREVLFDYLKGRWNKEDIQKYIKFSTVVRWGNFNRNHKETNVA